MLRVKNEDFNKNSVLAIMPDGCQSKCATSIAPDMPVLIVSGHKI
jgi:hypothetical protein